jgi:hypothetical protein
VKTTYKQVVVEPKVSNPLVHMVDVNMAITRSKVTKEHVFKNKKPINKSLLLIRKRNKTTTIFCPDYIRDANRKPTR